MRGYRAGRLSRDEAMWRLWASGLSLEAIGRALGKPASSVYIAAAGFGGIRPRQRRRAEVALKQREREEISRGLAAGLSIRRIACGIGRAASTVSREVARNGGRGSYRAELAEKAAWNRAKRPKTCKLRTHARLRLQVARRLKQGWSPQQIAERLRKAHPDDSRMHVSHETIYQTLFVQARGVFRKELTDHLRRCGYIRRAKSLKREANGIPNAISIRERPSEAQDRAVPGHWEGDLIAGGRSSHVATLVERHSRFVMLMKVDSKDSVAFADALARKIRTLPRELKRSLTWDRGTEMAAHERFTIASDVKVYFCDPRSPWQRGSNENTNGLLRQYLPKDDDFSRYSQADLDKIAARLNGRPRMTLDWDTPAEVLTRGVAATP